MSQANPVEEYIIPDIINYLVEVSAIPEPPPPEYTPENPVELIEKFKPHMVTSEPVEGKINVLSAAVSDALERHLTSAHDMAVSRLAMIENVTRLYKDNANYVNIILYIAELLSIKVIERRYVKTDEYTGFVEYAVPVTVNSKLGYNQLLEIASKASSHIKRLSEDYKTYKSNYDALIRAHEFLNGKFKAVDLRLKEAEKKLKEPQKFTNLPAYVLYSSVRGRYLYKAEKNGKPYVKSTKEFNISCLFPTREAAQAVFTLSATNKLKKPIKEWWNYKLVHLAHGSIEEDKGMAEFIQKKFKG